MCAIEAGRRGRSVVLIDHAHAVGEKIRISGGGRCNFTNVHARPENYISANPHFCVSALKRYTPADFIAKVDGYGIAHHEKALGQLFCDGSSKDIITMLIDECRDAGVTIKLETSIKKITKTSDGFEVRTRSARLSCTSLVVATGGKSIPKMGATDFAYTIAEQFDIDVITPRPALVPLTFAPNLLEQTAPMSGVSADAIVSCNGKSFREALLFTHRGLSGPSILQISSYWREGDVVSINLAPDCDIGQMLKQGRQHEGKKTAASVLTGQLPKRLAAFTADNANATGKLGEYSDARIQTLANSVNSWDVTPVGSEGYRTAEVTLGGVNTDALSSKTMETKTVPGLYFIGEGVDVTGWLGGYNFQWAWASGWAAGQYT